MNHDYASAWNIRRENHRRNIMAVRYAIFKISITIILAAVIGAFILATIAE